MNKAALRLTLRPDDDGTGELIAEVSANGFAGRGSAYFNLTDIIAFGDELTRYPLKAVSPPMLRGGYWGECDKSELQQIHLLIKAYPINSTGSLGVAVQLATPMYEYDRLESQHAVRTEIKTDYNSLASFGKQLKELGQQKRAEAVLLEAKVF